MFPGAETQLFLLLNCYDGSFQGSGSSQLAVSSLIPRQGLGFGRGGPWAFPHALIGYCCCSGGYHLFQASGLWTHSIYRPGFPYLERKSKIWFFFNTEGYWAFKMGFIPTAFGCGLAKRKSRDFLVLLHSISVPGS